MSFGEYPVQLEEIIGDQDIHSIINDRLIASGYPGSNTDKYFVRGLPEVIVRHTQGMPEADQADKVVKAYNDLPMHNIPALPYISVEHNGEIYVVTRKMHGARLKDMLHEGMLPDLHTTIDERWASITRYVCGGRLEGRDCATDIHGSSQYMYGRTVVDNSDDLKLVDLGEWTIDYSRWAN